MPRLLLVAGARPNFMKVAPLADALGCMPEVEQHLVHTGQHYDAAMSQVFFDDLGMRRPDLDLEVGSGSQAEQTARTMLAFEPVCRARQPDVVVVVGDVNSTVACALVAAKLGIRVAHVEAGLRSFDRSMPEEINRVLTDHLSDVLFTTERSANENLLREGVPQQRVHFVGNTMIDTLLRHREHALRLDFPREYGLEAGRYVLATLHRPANVDSAATLGRILGALADVARDIPVILPLHPRTHRNVQTFELGGVLGAVRALEPLGYLAFLGLMANAGVVVTDSGGIQEETTALGVPCLTVRPNTERPITVELGTNRLVAAERVALRTAILERIGMPRTTQPPSIPAVPLWDGHAAERIAGVLLDFVGSDA